MKMLIVSQRTSRTHRICLLALSIVFLSMMIGCSWLAPPRQDLMASSQVEKWARNNQNLKQLKGVMRIHLHSSQRNVSGRAGWAAVFPDRMRVEWLTLLGQPLIKFTANGCTIAIDVYGENEHHRIKQTPMALKHYFQIPMGVEDLLNILSGRPPLPEYAAAQMKSGVEQGYQIVLMSRWHARVAELVGADDGMLQQMSVYGDDGVLLYQIRWKSWQRQEGYMFPGDIEITTGAGESVGLLVDRLFLDTPVAPELFTIENTP